MGEIATLQAVYTNVIAGIFSNAHTIFDHYQHLESILPELGTFFDKMMTVQGHLLRRKR